MVRAYGARAVPRRVAGPSIAGGGTAGGGHEELAGTDNVHGTGLDVELVDFETQSMEQRRGFAVGDDRQGVATGPLERVEDLHVPLPSWDVPEVDPFGYHYTSA